jgi:hypothetical protein
MEKKFAKHLNNTSKYQYKTPGTPGNIILRPTENDIPLSPDDQTFYRSGSLQVRQDQIYAILSEN